MEHPQLKNLYEQVVAGNFKWDRWGLLSVLSDYVLYYTDGQILEIGCGESSIHLSKLAEKYNRKCFHVEFSKSGVQNMKNTKGYFGKNSEVFNMKSDEFFERLEVKMARQPKIALAFIDGDHTFEQAKRDYINTHKYVVNNGFIFLHDTYPPDESWTVPEKCGGVYKIRRQMELDNQEMMFTFTRSAFDVGLTMIQKRE